MGVDTKVEHLERLCEHYLKRQRMCKRDSMREELLMRWFLEVKKWIKELKDK